MYFFIHCRWRFVIHAGIDGYSRLPVYCHCSTDNRAQAVLQLFQGAVDMYGLPSRVRCDRGVENYDVGYYRVRLYESAYLPSEFRTSQPRLYALIRLQKWAIPDNEDIYTPMEEGW